MNDSGTVEQTPMQPPKVELEPWARPQEGGESRFSPEQISKMEDILRAEGVKFIGKKQLAIPEVTPAKIQPLFSEESNDVVIQALSNLTFFLNGTRKADPFEQRHDERQSWKDQNMQKYGLLFNQVFVEGNQLRPVVLSVPIEAIDALSLFARDVKLSDRLEKVNARLKSMILDERGKTDKYTQMSTAQQLVIADRFEKEVIKLLVYLDSLTNPQSSE